MNGDLIQKTLTFYRVFFCLFLFFLLLVLKEIAIGHGCKATAFKLLVMEPPSLKKTK